MKGDISPMELIITQSAENKIKELNTSEQEYLWLFYDTDDCGCGVSGMPTVRLTDQTNDYFKFVDNKSFQVIIHKQQATFFAEQMKLDYLGNSFRLSGPEGVLNPIIPESDLLKGEVA